MTFSATEQLPEASMIAPDVPLEPLPKGWTSLPRAFLRVARRHWSKVAMADSLKVSLTYGSALTRALALGRVFRRELGPEPYVGVMVPPSVAGAVANIALLFLGKIPINLNYSASREIIDKGMERAGIKQVITSRKFLERTNLKPSGSLLFLEDIPPKVGPLDKVWAATVARVVPEAMLGSFLPGLKDDRVDSVATVMFTSGSTGEPKGVVLTHGNVLSNVHQMRQHLQLDPIDVVALGVLPFFHSFGYTVGIWTILLLGKKAVYHSNPLDAKVVGDLCEQHKVTLLATSPTFFRHYVQRCKPEQFQHLYHLQLGAEKLKPEVAEQIERAIHLSPQEGYGTTEMSPVAAVNVPFSYKLGDGRTIDGNRRGTVGRPLPGTAVRSIDPETGADLPRGTEGIILIKGPQIMAGYLDNPEATAKVLKDGWYNSGDLGYLDGDGFLVVTGRLSRFAKIAGEMVPHEGVESALIAALGGDERCVAVTSIPDPRRGERLAVIHTPWTTTPAEVCRKLIAGTIPKLWIPSPDDFIEVAEIPVLGTGKLDLRGIREIAARLEPKIN